MLTLAIETSSDRCGVAVADQFGTRAVDEFPHQMHLLTELASRLQQLLALAHVELSQIELFAVDIGPGSFTGIRIGIISAKTLAWATGKPLIGVGALAAAAASVEAASSGTVLSLIRARPGFAYWQVVAADSRSHLTEPSIVACAELGNACRAAGVSACTVCVSGESDWSQVALQSVADAAIEADVCSIPAPSVRAVCQLAWRQAADHETFDPLAVAPLYVADPLIGPPAARR